MDEFGKDHTKQITDAVLKESLYMAKRNQVAQENTSQAIVEDKSEGEVIVYPDVGRKLTFDNLDYRQEVHYMTEDHQNIDKHVVTVMSTENRVSGSHLSDEPKADGVLNMENGKCLPSPQDNAKQRENYITLVERIVATNIPCMNFLLNASTPHIPNQYRNEVKNKTETVSIHQVIGF